MSDIESIEEGLKETRKSLAYIIGYLESSLLTIKELSSTEQHTKVYHKVDEAIKFIKENFPKEKIYKTEMNGIEIDIKCSGYDGTVEGSD
jgi:hypothetical protein